MSKINERTRLIILNSPANPTGGVVPRGDFDALIEGLCTWPDVAIMSDEIYGQMLYDNREHVSLIRYPEINDRLILLDGWSKTYAMTGWRLGYSVWPEKVAPHAEKLCVNIHSCVNSSAQFAGIAALTGDQSPVKAMVSAFDERRTVIVNELNKIPGFSCIQPGGAFYAFPNITQTGLQSDELQKKILEEAGVAVISGTSFGEYGEGYLRFSYANSTENILKAVDLIKGMSVELNCLYFNQPPNISSIQAAAKL